MERPAITPEAAARSSAPRFKLNALPPVAIFNDNWAPTLTFIASLGRRRVPLLLYGSGAGRFSRYCRARYRCPPINDMGQFVPWLREEIRSGRISRVAPTTDLLAYYIAQLRDEFSPEVRRTIPSPQEIESCLFKMRFAGSCVAVGQPTAAILSPDNPAKVAEIAADLRYPLLLKPKSHLVAGWAERGRLIHNPAELKRHFVPYPVQRGHEPLAARLPELRWPLIQEYLAAARQRVYSVSGLKDADHGIVAASLSYKSEQWPLDIGTSTRQVSCRNEAILAAGLAAVDRLLSRGLFELELVSDGEQLRAIDLNPRAFGFIALDVALGRDLPWLWLQSTLHPVRPEPTPDALVGRLEARHHLIHLVRSLIRWPPFLAEHRQPDAEPARRSISMVGHVHDPLPMLISNLALLRHPRSLFVTQLQAARQARQRHRGESGG